MHNNARTLNTTRSVSVLVLIESIAKTMADMFNDVIYHRLIADKFDRRMTPSTSAPNVIKLSMSSGGFCDAGPGTGA